MKARNVVLTVLALGGVGVVAYALVPKAPPLQTVTTVKVKQETFVKEVSAVGTVRAMQSRPLAFVTPGTVSRVQVKVGDAVRKGQTLIELETRNLQTELEGAKVSLRAAEADLLKAQGGVETDQMEASKGVAQASNALIAAQNAHLQATEQLKLQQQLHQIGSISRMDLQQAQNTAQDSSLKLQSAQLDLQSARLKQQGAQKLAEASVQNARSALESARTRVRNLETQLQDAVLRSPLDGVVSSLSVTPGGFAAAGSAAVEITDLGQLYLEVPFDETRARDLAPGQQATIEFDAFPNQKTTGKVVRVNPTATVNQGGASQVTSVQVQVAFQKAGVKPGFTASVKVETLRRAGALVLPLEAITENEGAHVFRVKPDQNGEGTLEKVNVRILDRNLKVAAVEGVSSQDQVLTLNLDTVQAGEKVRIENHDGH